MKKITTFLMAISLLGGASANAFDNNTDVITFEKSKGSKKTKFSMPNSLDMSTEKGKGKKSC